MGRPGVVEVLVYLAAALTAAGFGVLVATNWEQLATGPRIAIPGASAVVVFAAGYALRRTQSDAMVRGASLLWLLAGGLAATTAAIVASEGGWSENDVALAAGIVAVGASIALWAPMRMHPQVAGIGGAAFLFASAVGARVGEDWIMATMGGVIALFGLSALAAAESGMLTPQTAARLLAAAGLGLGGFFAAMPPSPPMMALVTAAAVIVLLASGMRFQSLVYVGFGVLTAFAGMLSLIIRYVESPTLAGLALVALGLLLMLAIAALGRTRPWERWRRRTLDSDDTAEHARA